MPSFPRLLPGLVPIAALAVFACTPAPGTTEVFEAPATGNFPAPQGNVVSVADAAPRKPRFSPFVVIHNTRNPFRSPVPSPKGSPTPTPTPEPGATAPQFVGNLSLSLLAGGATGAPADGTASGTPKSILRTDPGTGTHPGAFGLAMKVSAAFETEEVLFVDGLGGALRRFNPTTGQVTTLPAIIGEGVGQLTGLVYDPGTKAYYASDSTLRRVYRITLPEGAATSAAPVAALVAGDPAATTGQAQPAKADGAGTAARFGEPRGLLVLGQALFVADAGHHLIRRIDLSSTAFTTTTVAGSVLGKPTNLDEDVAATSALFNGPSALAGTKASDIFIADQKNHLIRRLDIGTGKVTVFTGTGVSGNQDGARGSATFNEPLSVAATGTHLFVGERAGARLRVVTLATKAVGTALGTNTQGTGVGLKDSAGFVNPLALATLLDAASGFKSVYVLDGGQAALGARLVKATGTL